jgi:glycerophosphoryl diester phosphodiesterase
MSRARVFAAVFGALCLAASADNVRSAETTLPTAAQCVARAGVLVIAHRGDSKVAPENTLPAFESAVKAKADLVELDYMHSADAVPVVLHDRTLDRTTNAIALWHGEKIRVDAKSLAELKLLDAGSWFDPKFAGTRLPTLSEALDAIQAGSMTLIERKGGDPATCIRLLKDKNLLDRVVVQSFDWDYLEGCRRLAPNLVLAALGDKEVTTEKLDQVAKTGARAVGWADRYTTAQTIAAIHARGWKAWVYTVDEPGRARQLVRAKVDGLITNQPAAIRQVVESAISSR